MPVGTSRSPRSSAGRSVRTWTPATPPRARGHDYSFADTGLDLAAHRALVAPYQERFGVPTEV